MAQAWVPVLVKLKVVLNGARTLQDRASAIRSVQDLVLSRFAGDELQLGYQYQTVTGFSARVNQRGLEKIAKNPWVEAIAIDQKVYVSLEQSRPLINADDTETNLFVTGKNITVAVMDTGVQTSHAVLFNDIEGDFQILNGTTSTGGDDNNGHGSNVAGIITSTGDDQSFVGQVGRGIAPDVKILNLKTIASDGSGAVSDQIAALEFILTNLNDFANLKVLNMSFGTDQVFSAIPCNTADSENQLFSQAVNNVFNQGIILLATSGNNGSSTGLSAPSCFQNLVSVGVVYGGGEGRQPSTGTYAVDCFDSDTQADQIACFTNRANFPRVDTLVAVQKVFTQLPPTPTARPALPRQLQLQHGNFFKQYKAVGILSSMTH